MNLTEVWSLYKADKQIQGYSPQTLKSYYVQFNLSVKSFGNISIQELSTNSLKVYLGKAAEKLKPSSLGHRIRFIKSLFRWAQDENLINGNPASKIKEPKVELRVPKYLSEVEIEHLREACHTTFKNALFEFMYSAGCRIGEAITLDRTSINFSNQSAIVLGKGNKEREVYFNTRCEIWLKRYLSERKDHEEALFVTTRAPHRMSISQARNVIKLIAKRTDIKKSIHPHQLRHSYATNLLNNGAPLEVIQNLMGHEKSETTKMYAYLSGAMRRDLYRKYF
ncbi:tyrosine-type recombinase/integrase [Peribacillus simplex]|uniref:tyrosine-type recombinase/integrase n=1 Tax=Peribacillus simplex TaxID=1478 RepID=UPI0024C137BE|nr:tyrosine-type recombinase/integrase [Peribacillus simplex]WHY54767.1 tyrosine-type recombinase/integrase [Peribacillus simplex]